MSISQWRRLALVLLLSWVAVSGLSCSGTVDTQQDDGKIYVVNNTIPFVLGVEANRRFSTSVWVVYDGVRYDIPFNMDWDRNPTGAGAFELTEELLPGGTTVTLECVVLHGISEVKNITFVVDGSVTIEIHWEEWTDSFTTYLLRIVPGRWDGIHRYI
ncbi:MAG: hypothetical protein KAR36_13845 [Candidatus Latescibacteria bacterium]|nr:hypothetical protein [Candidatus Latescibacterota bacterium]